MSVSPQLQRLDQARPVGLIARLPRLARTGATPRVDRISAWATNRLIRRNSVLATLTMIRSSGPLAPRCKRRLPDRISTTGAVFAGQMFGSDLLRPDAHSSSSTIRTRPPSSHCRRAAAPSPTTPMLAAAFLALAQFVHHLTSAASSDLDPRQQDHIVDRLGHESRRPRPPGRLNACRLAPVQSRHQHHRNVPRLRIAPSTADKSRNRPCQAS